MCSCTYAYQQWVECGGHVWLFPAAFHANVLRIEIRLIHKTLYWFVPVFFLCDVFTWRGLQLGIMYSWILDYQFLTLSLMIIHSVASSRRQRRQWLIICFCLCDSGDRRYLSVWLSCFAGCFSTFFLLHVKGGKWGCFVAVACNLCISQGFEIVEENAFSCWFHILVDQNFYIFEKYSFAVQIQFYFEVGKSITTTQRMSNALK